MPFTFFGSATTGGCVLSSSSVRVPSSLAKKLHGGNSGRGVGSKTRSVRATLRFNTFAASACAASHSACSFASASSRSRAMRFSYASSFSTRALTIWSARFSIASVMTPSRRLRSVSSYDSGRIFAPSIFALAC